MGKAMPDSKHLKWNQDFGTDAEDDTRPADAALPADEPAANDADGWQQYRRLISKATAPHVRREGIDPALYSCKGYRVWTDHVRRNWSNESTDDDE